MKKNDSPKKQVKPIPHCRQKILVMLFALGISIHGSANSSVNVPHELVPSITLEQSGIAIEDIDAGPGCNYILYTFAITNTSTNGEVFTNVNLNHSLPVLGDLISFNGGDDNNNNLLDVDEVWEYSALYTIQSADINSGQVASEADVTAEVQGQPGVTVSDLDTSEIDLTFCQGGIAVVKQGFATNDLDQGGLGCVYIFYNFIVTNQGQQVLENPILTDPLLGGEIVGPEEGDSNTNGKLDLNETWVYQYVYEIQPEDIANGIVENQAEVTANVDGKPDVTVSDLSHFDDPLDDAPTVISLLHCQTPDMGLIKEGVVVDANGDGCLESILYTFTLTNTGNADLDGIILEDELLGGEIPGPLAVSDDGNDGILSVGETWTYFALYAITQEDIDNSSVVNQAEVSGFAPDDSLVEDLSDDDSLFEDEFTRTPVPEDSCTDGSPDPESGLGLIKQGALIDNDNNECAESILYNFSIINLTDIDMVNVVLTDELLGGVIAGPISDENNDGVLSPDEVWTYQATYDIQQVDIDAGSFVNQASATSSLFGLDIQYDDLSDNDSYTEDEPTVINIPVDACPGGDNPGGPGEPGEPIGFEIFNGITPNEDGLNDFFFIQGIEIYPQNKLQIFNRWGVMVYEKEGYGQGNDLFYGISDGRVTVRKNEELPSGTYFYILTFTGNNPGEAEYTGYLYINRG
ncbi:gliding motility-associated C-terminal domain-containing protein [Muricauda oceani]|uniref:Gliding motility-associated C-terminal domain-containing protein n=1 Tax=Flagellimonas oceani TaxID=2698672 RepID=A0A6G7J1R7_9FLAO|nr:gliding motility-associated C-terminal domain-containing protein [Allomuricauda oceani]MBW8241575.1 gliding motility-associated C-terminal domain-containing protein [Allomuricauda oceani]QII44437.1 gliding motility-associated C-terminal domain-containing protein [Allomuricauda oceani]